MFVIRRSHEARRLVSPLTCEPFYSARFHRVTVSEAAAKRRPVRHTSVHPAWFHASPVQRVPRLPPMKRWVMKMVLARLAASGASCRHPLWLLSW